MTRTLTLRLLFFCLICFTLERSVLAEHLPVKTYTTTDGLASNVVNKIVRDSRGFLWFCTANGLSRFDGYTFTNFGTEQGLPHANVNDFLETRRGEYWLATDGGLVHLNPRGTPEQRVSFANEAIQPAPMFTVLVPDDQDRRARAITVLLEDRSGTIWCGSMKGFLKLQTAGGRFALQPVDLRMPGDFPEQRVVSDVLEDRFGTLWIATPTGLYRRWSDGRSARYTGLPSDYLSDLFESRAGQLWVGTTLNGFFRIVFDESPAPPRVADAFTYKDGLPTSWVFRFFETSDHRFWIATARGLVEFFVNGDQKGQRFHSYTTRNGLSYHDINAINEDLGGNLWLGTSTSGAMRLAHNGFVTYDQQDGLSGVNAIFADPAGELCFRGDVLGSGGKSVFEGAELNLLRFKPDEVFSRLGSFDGTSLAWFKPSVITDMGWVMEGNTLVTRSGEGWVASGHGLYRFPPLARLAEVKETRPLAVYTPADGLASGQVFRLFEDSRGDVWISTISSLQNGLARWDRAGNTIINLAGAQGLPSIKDNLPRSIGEDKAGNVWIGFNTGVARYAQGSFRFFTTNDGLPPGAIMNIYLDRTDRLWFASARSGLIRVDDSASNQPIFNSYTTAQGLSANTTEVITDDLQGHIFVGGGNGIDRFDPGTGRVKHFTTADGLASGSLRAAYRDRNGTLWFGTTGGLSRFSPEPAQPDAPPPVLIVGCRVAGSAQTVSILGEKDITLPALAANQNQIQLDFVGLGFASGEVLRYQYKLEGADRDWSVPTEQRTVNYAQLASGSYRFLVRAINSDGGVSLTPASVSFRVLPHVYERWWFLSLTGLVVGLLGYGWYRTRVAHLIGVERVRTNIAADLHDDIGTNLTRIAILSEVANSQLAQTDPQVASPLTSIARISRESVTSMSDIVWAINPRRDSLLDLILRMRRFANEICANGKIQVQFRTPDTGQQQKLGADLRRNAFLVFKEALNNAVRHAECSSIEIDLNLGPRWLQLKITDDGRGFDTSVAVEGHGMISMQRRAQTLRGEFQVKSQPGRGTEILLRLPR